MGKVKAVQPYPRGSGVLTIGRAAKAVGLTPKAIRLYETRGLLDPPARTAAGYRLYTESHITQLRFISAARKLGLHVDQIRDILDTAHQGRRPCRTTRVILEQRIDEIDTLIRELGELRQALSHARDVNETHDTDSDPGLICPVIEDA